MGEPSSDRKELKASWKTDREVPVLSLDDVAKHNTKKDIWMVIHGGVYDVSEYLRDHPGGPDALLEVAGTDATSAYEDVGHSEDAREIIQSLLVGHLEGAKGSDWDSAEAEVPRVSVVHPAPQLHEGHHQTSRLLRVGTGVGAAALGVAVVSYFAKGLHLPSPHLPNSHHLGKGGFLQGFLLASGSASAIGIAAALYLSKLMNIDVDFTALPAHKASKNATRLAQTPVGSLSPQTYRKFALREKTELANGVYRFVFALPKPSSVLGLPIGQHIGVRGTVDGHAVTRSYTPVSNNRDLGRLELLIRIYPDGQLGRYMKGLEPGDLVDIRGPKGAMRYRKGMSKELGMVGGGTGITPLFQVVRAICEDKTDDTRVSLVYASRSEDDIMLRKRLDSFATASNGQFTVYYIVSEAPPGWKHGTGRIDHEILKEKMPAVSDDNKVLVCGPPGLVNSAKNNLVELGWKEPGSVSKMSDQIFCF